MKYKYGVYGQIGAESHPARGAWIEIHLLRLRGGIFGVAPRKGCVD